MMLHLAILTSILAFNSVLGRSCWSCVGVQCMQSDRWLPLNCPNEQTHCYSFLDDFGSVTNRGCAHSSSCLTVPGWEIGTKCYTCDSDKCNGRRLSNSDDKDATFLKCWSCSDSQCSSETEWQELICNSEDKYCYSFSTDDGTVYKKGCGREFLHYNGGCGVCLHRHESCLSGDGWQFGQLCQVCESDLCNGKRISS